MGNSRCQHVCNLFMCRECQIVKKWRMSTISQETSQELGKSKKKLHVAILKMNSLHSLHLTCRVMNSRHVNSTHDSTRPHQFTLCVANPGPSFHNVFVFCFYWLIVYCKSCSFMYVLKSIFIKMLLA